MKLLLGLFVVLLVLLFFFGNVTINGMEARGIPRLIVSIVGSILLSLMIGLPVLGLISLF